MLNDVRVRPFALAALGGVLHFLGFVGYGVWPLALVCLAPLWQGCEESSSNAARAAALGLLFGWVSYAGGYLWLWAILDIFLAGNWWLGALFWLADSLWFALRYALYGLLYAWLRGRGSAIAVAALAPLLVLEWLYPLLFPVHLGHALAGRATLVQMSDLGGPLLLTAFAALINLAVFSSWRWWRGASAAPRLIWGLAVAALLAAWWYGAARIAAVDAAVAAAARLRIGIVQGNLGVREKGGDARRDHQLYVEQSRELLAMAPDLDLVVWPETVYSLGLRGPLPISGDLVRRDLPVPLLFGAAFVRTDSGQRLTYNAALLVGEDGVIRSGYEKNLLIPFTEYLPFESWLPGLRERFSVASRFHAATTTPALRFGAWRIATPICYEAVRPAFVRRMVNDGRANLIVTLANDAWFGHSQGPWLHLAMARLRAIEERRFLVRATNSGISAIVDPCGREVVASGMLTRENLRGEVALLDEQTWYARCGDWVGWAAVLALGVSIRRRVMPGSA